MSNKQVPDWLAFFKKRKQNKVQKCSHLLAPLFEDHEKKITNLVELISKKEMNWKSYPAYWNQFASREEYQISNGIKVFATDKKEDADWLAEKLNSIEQINRFDDGIFLTDEGDLVKVPV